MSSSPNNAANGSANNTERARLTEQEKKNNHIVSEQKRRLAIRQGFDRLACIIPGMEGQGRSEAVVLENAVKFDDLAERRRQKLQKILVGKSVTQNEFDAAYLTKTEDDNHNKMEKGDDDATTSD